MKTQITNKSPRWELCFEHILYVINYRKYMYKKNHPFHPGDNDKTVKVKNSDFFTKNLITKRSCLLSWHLIKYPIQVYSNKGPRPFPRGDNNEIAKIHGRNSKSFFSRSIGPISTKLGTKQLRIMGTKEFSKEGCHTFPRGDNKNLLHKNHWASFNQSWHKQYLGDGNSS